MIMQRMGHIPAEVQREKKTLNKSQRALLIKSNSEDISLGNALHQTSLFCFYASKSHSPQLQQQKIVCQKLSETYLLEVFSTV